MSKSKYNTNIKKNLIKINNKYIIIKKISLKYNKFYHLKNSISKRNNY